MNGGVRSDHLPASSDAATLQRIAPLARPLSEGEPQGGRRRVDGVVCHRTTLFETSILIAPDGEMEMIVDDPIAKALVIAAERTEGFLLRLGAIYEEAGKDHVDTYDE